MRQIRWATTAIAIFVLLCCGSSSRSLASPGGPGFPTEVDLTIERIDPDTLHLGDPPVVTVRIRNLGTMPASESVTGVRVDGAPTYWTYGTPPIPAGGAVDLACNIGALEAGVHTIHACVDMLGMVGDGDTTNNCTAEPIWVQGSGPAEGPAETGSSARPELHAVVNPARTNQSLDLRFSTPISGGIRIDLFDAGGRQIARIVDQKLTAGEHLVRWSPTGATGLPGGIYFLRLLSPAGQAVRKIVICG